MKINLLVDAAYAFDYISILNIKYIEKPTEENKSNLIQCEMDITNSIDNIDLIDNIFKSKEYTDLWNSNKKVFDLVSLAKNNLCLASEVDSANYSRYLCKKALQEKFFCSSISEVKIGY